MRTATKYSNADYQREVSNLVSREVYYCASTLLYELAQKAESFPDYYDDLLDAFRGLPDYEEAATDSGWEQFTDEFGVECWRTEDGDTWAGTAEDVCNEFDIDTSDYEPEIFEHWIVSDWLASKLEAHGERVLNDFFGLTVWCRSTTGQSISIDSVICDIYDELHS